MLSSGNIWWEEGAVPLLDFPSSRCHYSSYVEFANWWILEYIYLTDIHGFEIINLMSADTRDEVR